MQENVEIIFHSMYLQVDSLATHLLAEPTIPRTTNK